ncbi:MAG: ABC transporter ATP-binding protein [Gemmatimonadetes bacterium]|nr:ABC transporter ATP-binding protein [Gemmatimonadota bacterium]
MIIWRRVLAYLAPHRGALLLSVAASAAYSALDAFSFVLLIPFLGTVFGESEASGAAGEGSARLEQALDFTVGRFVDLDGDPQAAVGGIIVFLLLLVALKNAVDFARAWLTARVEQGVARDLRNRVYGHLLDLDLAFFARVHTGQVVSRLTHDVEQLRTLVTRELTRTAAAVLQFLACLYWMIEISARLTAAAFVVVPLTMVIWGPLVRRLRRGDRRVLNLAGVVSSHIQETVSAIRVVKSSSAEPIERRRFRNLTRTYFDAFLRTVRLRALAGPITEFLVAAGTAILLWYGARMVLVDGTLSGAAFLGFILLSTRLYSPVKYLSKLPALIQPGLAGAERVFEFLDAPAEIRERDGTREFTGVEREIRYRGVSMEYRAGDRVLRDVDFRVPAGSVVALVGPSGAGKTTIVDLLARFYDPLSGAVEVDGTDVREFRLASLRAGLGVVSQDTVLFHDTVRANIAYGTPGAPADEVEKAARAARAHDFITTLPDGYDTVVGERGTTLSGGQRQRIAIARAVLRNPPILILDEATSALDTESERLVQEAVERLLRGRTVFVIAHRLSTIRRADLIVVVDGGRLVQQGTHATLMAEGGLYRRLRELQFQ